MDIASENNDMEMLTEGRRGVKKGYERMKNLVLSMIDYSRDREISVLSVNLNNVISEAVDTQREAAGEKGVKLVEEYDGSLPPVSVDPVRIERMVVNLVQNALDAVKENTGVIRIGTKFSSEQGVVDIWVADNGCGIAEENVDKVFDVFYSTKGQKGTGFGLAIVQKVVKEHSGAIEVRSEAGKGARFIVKLPATKSGNAEH
jgi:signal transduction histidine kinase